MGASPHVRQTPAAGARNHAGEPATVAFRRPADDFGASAAAVLDQRWDVPVVLRLPDLNAPASSPTAQFANAGNPLVGKLMWGATGVLAIVAVWLVASGNPEKRQTLPEAPAWNPPDQFTAPIVPPAASASLHPVPNWKAPHDANSADRLEPSSSRGPWRAGAQVMQPGAPPETDPGITDKSAQPDSASWPGDAWPGRRPDADQSREPRAAPANDSMPALPPDESPPADPSAAPSDPWPGDPQWPDDARNGGASAPADVRTARRPAPPGTNPPQRRRPEARLEGGIQNMDVSPSYDGTRSSIH